MNAGVDTSAITFQLTTSQGGRHGVYAEYTYNGDISTHDLTRRSTDELTKSIKTEYISTHDLTRRSTRRF